MVQLNTDCRFRVVRNVYYRLNQYTDETIYTYEIQFKKIGVKEFTVEISNYSYTDYTKDTLAGSTVKKLIEEYNSVFFPVLLHIKNDVCFIKNKEIIIKRLEHKNDQLRIDSKYLIDSDTAKIRNITRHYVIDDIKKFFLKNTSNDYIMEDHCSKGMMEVLLFSLDKAKKRNGYYLKFNLSPFNCKIKWECEKNTGQDNVLRYIGQIKNTRKLFKQFKKYAELEGICLNKIESQIPVCSELNHTIHFDPENFAFDFFEMDIKIEHDFYDYKETIYISAINKKLYNE